MRRSGVWVAGAVFVVVVVFTVGFSVLSAVRGNEGYALRLVMPNAAGIVVNTSVQVKGFPAGEVANVSARDGKAVVDVVLDDEHTPVTSGTTAKVVWKAALGERSVEVVPGPAGNSPLPSGAMVNVGNSQVDVDELLSALDPPTRARLSGTIKQLDATVKDRPDQVHEVVKQAGPTVGALGEVLRAVGSDGHAIRQVVSDLRNLISPLKERQGELGQVVNDLTKTTRDVAPAHEQLGEALQELPSTLAEGKNTLDRVPDAVDETVPLLNDLRPATGRLKSVSKNLSPLLQDLRPTMADLRPTLNSASTLLGKTPGLLDSAHSVIPDVTVTVNKLNPAVNFLRPYTPDLAAWLTNWGSAFANYDSQGHFANAILRAGASSVDENPGLPLTMNVNANPPPGMASDHPWTDANGSGMR